MNKLIVIVLCLIGLSACNKYGGPICNSNEIAGTDGACYSCSQGTPELAGNTFGYCSKFNSGGVACCSTSWYNYNHITCYPTMPWLCSDGLCHTYDTGVCVYVP
jgi:hypothetical protein